MNHLIKGNMIKTWLFVLVLIFAANVHAQTPPFSVDGSTIYATGGNVGIHTTSPATNLDVNGNAQFGLGVNKSTFSATPGPTVYALALSSGISIGNNGVLSLGNGGILWNGVFYSSAGAIGGGASGGGLTWTNLTTGTSTVANCNYGYFIETASTYTLLLPGCSAGQTVQVVGQSTNTVYIALENISTQLFSYPPVYSTNAAVQFLNDNDSISFLAVNSSTWVMTASSEYTLPLGCIQSPQVFTANGTYVQPQGCTHWYGQCYGPGGGASTIGSNLGGPGGGGGGYAVGTGSLAAGSTMTITIGNGGAGANCNSNASAGSGPSSAGSFLVANAGSGGACSVNSETGAAGGTASTSGVVGGVATTGGSGGNGYPSSNYYSGGGGAPCTAGGNATSSAVGQGGVSSCGGGTGGNGGHSTGGSTSPSGYGAGAGGESGQAGTGGECIITPKP